jgi:hypothetical protein
MCFEPDTACTCDLIRRVRADTISVGKVARASRELAGRAYTNGYRNGYADGQDGKSPAIELGE